MNQKIRPLSAILGLIVLALVLVAFAAPVGANSDAQGNEAEMPTRSDDYSHPLGDEQRALRQEALEAVLRGNATSDGPVHQVANGQFVELEREGEDLIWTVLGEFPNLLHNTIAEPDRSVNNTTIWVPDFSRDHYMELLFSEEPGANSMRNFYIEQSSNRYAVNGDVTDWILVPGPAQSYDDDLGGSAVWQFVADSINGWYQSQLDAGKSSDEINDYLSQFDVWDRYDFDNDGNFDEPDGYIDHFQSVHAGEGNEAGGGVLGDDAIWSHRWYVQLVRRGQGGPTLPDGTENRRGGTPVGESRYWIGDYTIEPENGGVGVFAHEFAHDLGLPDLYDTSGGENGTGFWTLMSSGSWTTGNNEDIGSMPTHMGAWEKLQLGWLNYETAYAGQKSEHRLGPAMTNTKQAQGLVVMLPDKEVTLSNGEVRSYFNAYIAEFRQYRGYDDALRTGPYNFGFLDNPVLGDFVEHLPYQDGLLISYWDTSERNNRTNQHPGSGLILPIDAHPGAMYRADGGVWRNRMQTYDATFGLEPTDPLTLHWNSQPSEHPSLPAISIFDDRILHYDEANPLGSVKHPNTGTQIRIQSISAQGGFMQVEVRPAK